MKIRAGLRGSRRAERWFFGSMAVLIPLTVFIGFAPTFYLAKWLDPPHPIPPMTPLVYLHGTVFTSWILLFIVQTALIMGGRIDLHRRLGILGAGLAALMVLVGTVTALHGVVRAAGPPPPSTHRVFSPFHCSTCWFSQCLSLRASERGASRRPTSG